MKPRVPTKSDFPPGTEFLVFEFLCPLSISPSGDGVAYVAWYGGVPNRLDPKWLKIDNNWPADSFETWAELVERSIKKSLADNRSSKLSRPVMTQHDKYLVGLDFERLPLGAREMCIAVGQLQANEPIDQTCHFCGQPIVGETLGVPGTTWKISCACGKSNSTFRGL